MTMLTWKLEVTISVDDSWIADGFEPTPETIKDFIEDKLLGYAFESEKKVIVKTIKAPSIKAIRKLQGYE